MVAANQHRFCAGRCVVVSLVTLFIVGYGVVEFVTLPW